VLPTRAVLPESTQGSRRSVAREPHRPVQPTAGGGILAGSRGC
jgi:hypothetical protein